MTDAWHPPVGWNPEADCGAVEYLVNLKNGQSARAHLVRVGFVPYREGFREVARWYYTRRKIARITAVNRATVYFRLTR